MLPKVKELYPIIKEKTSDAMDVGFLSFEISDVEQLLEQFGREQTQKILEVLEDTLESQKGKLFRDEDLVAKTTSFGGSFVVFLFSPPRKKKTFTNTDLKTIGFRVTQKLEDMVNDAQVIQTLRRKIAVRFGYTVVQFDPEGELKHQITEATKSARLRCELEEIMVTFVANVSHELRTPLTCIKGYAETLLEGAYEDPELCQRWLEIIFDESRRLEQLIRDFLDVSLLDARQVEMRFAPCQPHLLLQHATEILKPHADKTGVNLAYHCEGETRDFLGDEGRLSQVIVNLIDNAVKYSPEQGTVDCRIFFDKERIRIEIEDYGTGIPKSELPKIFERFYRIETGEYGRFGGKGLGLSIARQIVEAHGGELLVRSEVGKGSLFEIVLSEAPEE